MREYLSFAPTYTYLFSLVSSLILSEIVFPISRQDVSYYPPVKKVVNGKIYFGKENKNDFKIIIYDLGGFNQDGFNRKGFDSNGLNIKGIDENGFNRKKELDCEEKVKQPIRKNPWSIYYVSEVLKNK